MKVRNVNAIVEFLYTQGESYINFKDSADCLNTSCYH